MSKNNSKSTWTQIGEWLIFIAGVAVGVLATRFFYNAALDLTTFLLAASAILVIVIVVKIRRKLHKED